MIVHITGKLIQKAPAHAVVEVGGVGYEIKISLHTFSAIKTLETCQLFTHQYIKGDVHALYGFASMEEKHWFLHLINVNSVGPRTAVTILSSLSPIELEQIIINNQVNILKSIKGIGEKAAQRIVLELKDKLGNSLASTGGNVVALQGTELIKQEALAALMKLGLGKLTAEKAIAKVCSTYAEVPLESLIKQALQVT
jgi:holliday junction DNA helicase RuvA